MPNINFLKVCIFLLYLTRWKIPTLLLFISLVLQINMCHSLNKYCICCSLANLFLLAISIGGIVIGCKFWKSKFILVEWICQKEVVQQIYEILRGLKRPFGWNFASLQYLKILSQIVVALSSRILFCLSQILLLHVNYAIVLYCAMLVFFSYARFNKY